MGRKTDNSILHKAKGAKCDEFYTQYCDIERELVHYPGQFAGKCVYCNCDDPLRSNFFKYFVEHFHSLGLKKLIASCHNGAGNGETGWYVIYEGEYADNSEAISSIVWLRGDGDFRSDECREFLAECDVVVTNPPFSLFREFIALVMEYKKEFLVIGNINAITYKEIFELIQDNKVWLGHNMGRGISGFIVPEAYGLYGTEARIDENGRRIISSNNCLWLTNLESMARNTFIPLTKSYKGNEADYPVYDNYDAINVNKTRDIPKDFGGVIGVPITFLHKYNPKQFEIVRFRKGDDGKDLSIGGKCPYFRILIRNVQFSRNCSAEVSNRRIYAEKAARPQSGNIDATQLPLF